MSMDSGWLGEQAERTLKKKVREPPTRFLSASQTMQKVKEITGESMKRVREAEYGPRANPARRIAVWAAAKQLRRLADCLDLEKCSKERLYAIRIRLDPFKTGLFFKPGDLTFCKTASVCFDLNNSVIKGHLSS
jgi:hypothetical protein